LWQYKDGAWKITRVISYDHHPTNLPDINSTAAKDVIPSDHLQLHLGP
jgi:hypothetical protein